MPRLLRAGAAVLAGLLAAACGHSAPANRASGHAASAPCRSATLCGAAASNYVAASHAWGPQLSSFQGTQAPLYLPTWRPTPPPRACVGMGGSAGPVSYQASLWVAPCNGAAGGSALLDRWVLSGGTASALGSAPAGTAPTGAGTAESLGPGIHGTLYGAGAGRPSPVVAWRRQGWSYEVTGTAAPGALIAAARHLAASAPAAPVPGVSGGSVVDEAGGAQAGIWILWQDGAWSYRLRGPDASVFAMAASLLLVPQID